MPRYFPDFDEFQAAAGDGGIVPVFRQLLADRLTPVTAFELLDGPEHSFLLESVVGGEKIGRYSFIAAGPKTIYQAYGGYATIQEAGQPPSEKFPTGDPLADISR